MANEHFFPPIEPFDTGTLAVDDPHRLYYEQCGNPYGEPMLFLHGGPGAGCTPIDRRFFDPDHFRVVLLDQRGSGRSHPPGELSNNSMSDTVRDIECLRELLGIEPGEAGLVKRVHDLLQRIAPSWSGFSREPTTTAAPFWTASLMKR